MCCIKFLKLRCISTIILLTSKLMKSFRPFIIEYQWIFTTFSIDFNSAGSHSVCVISLFGFLFYYTFILRGCYLADILNQITLRGLLPGSPVVIPFYNNTPKSNISSVCINEAHTSTPSVFFSVTYSFSSLFFPLCWLFIYPSSCLSTSWPLAKQNTHTHTDTYTHICLHNYSCEDIALNCIYCLHPNP